MKGAITFNKSGERAHSTADECAFVFWAGRARDKNNNRKDITIENKLARSPSSCGVAPRMRRSESTKQLPFFINYYTHAAAFHSLDLASPAAVSPVFIKFIVRRLAFPHPLKTKVIRTLNRMSFFVDAD